MTLLLVAVAIAIVAGVAVLVARDRPVLADEPVAGPAMDWPPGDGVDPDALAEARFTVALRGYRMDEVDRVLDDARTALAERDRRIADLERVVHVLAPPPSGIDQDGAVGMGAVDGSVVDGPAPGTSSDAPTEARG